MVGGSYRLTGNVVGTEQLDNCLSRRSDSQFDCLGARCKGSGFFVFSIHSQELHHGSNE